MIKTQIHNVCHVQKAKIGRKKGMKEIKSISPENVISICIT